MAESRASRKYNFNGEQCVLPAQVLEKMEKEWFNVEGVGITMLEMFNKQPKYLKLIDQGEAALRSLLNIPNDFKVYTMAGGQALQIAAVPLNLLGASDTATYVNTGYWSERSIEEAKRYVPNVNITQQLELNLNGRLSVVKSAEVAENSAYLHYVSDEPIEGISLLEQPRRPASESTVVVADLSGDFLTRTVDWTSIDVAYVSSEYQIGIAGSILLIVRESVLAKITPHKQCPYMIDYAALKATDGIPNTPPTFPMYVNAQVFLFAQEIGGVAAIESRIAGFAQRIYEQIDAFPLVYETKIDASHRSKVHIVFRVKGVQQDQHFVDEAEKAGIVGLQYRRSDALRISLGIGSTDESVNAVVDFVRKYAEQVTSSSTGN